LNFGLSEVWTFSVQFKVSLSERLSQKDGPSPSVYSLFQQLCWADQCFVCIRHVRLQGHFGDDLPSQSPVSWKQPDFSTNHLTDTDKTKHNYTTNSNSFNTET